jgi:hypothetical protein
MLSKSNSKSNGRSQLKQTKIEGSLGAALKQHLRQANVFDDEAGTVEEKLIQRLSANVQSYLQLCVLKVSNNTSICQQKQLKAHQQKIEYAETISEYISQPS